MIKTSEKARKAIAAEAKRMRITFERQRDLIMLDLAIGLEDRYTLDPCVLKLKSEGTGAVRIMPYKKKPKKGKK